MIGLEYILFIKGVSGTDLAEKLGISPQLINHWLKGRRTIPNEYVDLLSEEFNIPQEYITKQLEGKDRIEIELIYGSGHTEMDLLQLVSERNNLIRNYALLLEKCDELERSRQTMKEKMLNFIGEL